MAGVPTYLPPIQEDPLWEMVGIDDDPADGGEPVDIDDIIYGPRR